MPENEEDPSKRYRIGEDGEGWFRQDHRDADRTANIIIGIAIVGIVAVVGVVAVVATLVSYSGGFG